MSGLGEGTHHWHNCQKFLRGSQLYAPVHLLRKARTAIPQTYGAASVKFRVACSSLVVLKDR